MRVVKTTDGKLIGCRVAEVVRGSVLELGGYRIPVLFVTRSGGLVVAGNPNYIITFEQE